MRYSVECRFFVFLKICVLFLKILPIGIVGGFFMSKRKRFKKHLQKGRFYVHNDRNGGHPALLYKKRDQKNLYFIVMFTSSPGRNRIKLRYSLDPSRNNKSFVHDNPAISKRRDLGRKPLTRLKIHKEDKPLIRLIEKKK